MESSQAKHSMLPAERRSMFTLCLLYVSRMLGLFMVLPIFALYLSDYEGYNLQMLGIALGIYGFSQALLQLPMGFLSDRVGRKPVIIFGLLLFVAGSILAAGADSMWGIIIGRALQGAGAISSTVMALVSDVTRDEVRSKAMAMIGASIGLSFALAMVVGPKMAATYGLEGVFWLTAAIAVIGLVLVISTVKTPSLSSPTDALPALGMIYKVLSDGQLLRYNYGIFCLHMVLTAGFIVIPDMLAHSLSIPAHRHGYVYLMVLGGAFAAMLPLMILTEKRGLAKPAFLSAIGLMVVASVFLVLGVSGFWPFMITWFVFFLGFNWLEALLPSSLSKQVFAGGKGTAMGIYSSFQFMGVALGGAVGGTVVSHFGSRGVYIFIVVVLVSWLFAAMSMRPPKKAKTLVVKKPVEAMTQEWRAKLEAMTGVIEVAWFEAQSVAYVKVNAKEFDQSQLNALG